MDEMTTIQRVALQALRTFRDIGSVPSKHNLDKLESMLNTITASDVNLADPTKDRRSSLPGAPPVSHVNILDCPYFSMAVFIVRKGERLPLHDHAGMHGLCKVLYGSIQVLKYDRCNGKESDISSDTFERNGVKKCVFRGEEVFDSSSSPCLVTPMTGNYHSIKAFGGSAAFLDILAPPYSGEKGHDCLYYKECHRKEIPLNEEERVRYLMQIPCPSEFFCDSMPYKGPKVILDDLLKAYDKA